MVLSISLFILPTKCTPGLTGLYISYVEYRLERFIFTKDGGEMEGLITAETKVMTDIKHFIFAATERYTKSNGDERNPYPWPTLII